MFTGFECRDGVFFMKEVRGGDKDGINIGALEQFPVVGRDECVGAVALFEFGPGLRDNVGSRHEPHAGFWFVSMVGQFATAAGTNYANPEFIHCGVVLPIRPKFAS